MGKRIENIKSLELKFCISNIDESDWPLIETKDIREIINFLVDRRNRYGLNWNENLLLSVESGIDTLMMVDVARIELLV